ncbi:MAG: SgcJ/EcaC family oxidoreductase [Alphaproteobacteria bacterium]|nr:SgcJ/EcaC family oxidoreductase [Alphaproteobacteria bacterium]
MATLTNAEDERAIRAIAMQCEAAWNASDGAAYTAAMTDDIRFINILGDFLNGREMVEHSHRHVLDTVFKGSRMTFTIDAIQFIRPDVAMAFIHQKLMSHLPPDAVASTARQRQLSDKLHESQARGTMVLAKSSGQWRMISFQNTNIASIAAVRS